jgi:NADH:ubiquinone oxidoreductase subunit F (NADH-binding)
LSAYLADVSRCILCLEAGSAVAGKVQAILGSLREYGLIGRDVLGTSFCAEIEIREIPADMSTGQLYASLEAIAQGRAVPPMQPECLIYEELQPGPSIVLDPESAAFLAALFVDGETAGAGFEADRAQPSKVISLSGSVAGPMMAEIPCGLSIRRVVEEMGGGVRGGQQIAAVQLDPPRGGWIAPQDLESCAHCVTTGVGGQGDGDLDVLDTGMDIPAALAERMAALQDQSCGICLFCFEGSRQAARMLENMARGNRMERGRELVRGIAEGMETGCRCALGRGAARFLRSAEEAFSLIGSEDAESGRDGKPGAPPDVSSDGR